jgi:hypothetical protein
VIGEFNKLATVSVENYRVLGSTGLVFEQKWHGFGNYSLDAADRFLALQKLN